jgi:20S proteasome subunit beta 2
MLVVRSILAGITNDLGSGSSVDLCVITSTGTSYLRNQTSNMHRTFQLESNSSVSLDSAATHAANFATATRVTSSQ